MALPVSVHMGDFSNEIMQYMRVNLLGEDRHPALSPQFQEIIIMEGKKNQKE
jgi:hypothetical protein